MWWHSRASPLSTIRPVLARVLALIRWWCTAPASSSDGIGAVLVGGTTPRAPRSRSLGPAVLIGGTTPRAPRSRSLGPAVLIGGTPPRPPAAVHSGQQAGRHEPQC